jgi:hypothetical protein
MNQTTEWCNSTDTCQQLGISRSTLQVLKAEVLQAGIHYYRKGIGQRGPIYWNVAGIRSLMIERSVTQSYR